MRRGLAVAEVQISELETPLHKLETVYRRTIEELRTSAFAKSAFRPLIDAWLYGIEEDAATAAGVDEASAAQVEELLEQRLASVATATPVYPMVLRAYRAALEREDAATADALIAWLGGQPHVGAAAKRVAGIRQDVDHFLAMGFLQGLLAVLKGARHPGLVLVIDEVETLQRMRSDSRAKALNALRQWIDELDSGRYPGCISSSPAPRRSSTAGSGSSPCRRSRSGCTPTSAPTPASTTPGTPDPAHRVRSGPTDRGRGAGAGHLRGGLDGAGADPVGGRRRLPGRSGGGRRRRTRGQGRCLAAPVPQEARRRRARPRRPVPGLRSAATLFADHRGNGEGGGAARHHRRRGGAVTAGFDQLDPILQHHIVNSLGWPGLRPLQDEAVATIAAGSDAILLAPTAGGKTEAAMFPILTRMQQQRWRGISVLYLCPLKALLNNLQPRLAEYTAWMGRGAMTWHGDVGQSVRDRIKRDRPDVLLTTPESLESMLVSESVDAAEVLGGVQAVVVDEVHAFAGDDRGWHLLAVLARLESLLGRKLQRVGMSATVGNPDELLGWLQGGRTSPGRVIAPAVAGGTVVPEITVDSVGSVENAAKVIAALHSGEKRLVFVDSRRLAEELGTMLRGRGITTFVSHSSLSAAERRESEQAFAEARDCVIVATSTLELGIDVGDLDRVIQINAPRTVSSFLQRLGRTGRRPALLATACSWG